MKKLLLTLVILSTVAVSAAYLGKEPLFTADFTASAVTKQLGKNSSLVTGPNGTRALRFSCPKLNTVLVKWSLDPSKVTGLIELECRVRGEKLSSLADVGWLGPKVMLTVESPGAKTQYIEPAREFGTYPWKMVRRFILLPENVSKLELSIGIQKGRGTFEVAELTIRRAEEVTPEIADAFFRSQPAAAVQHDEIPRGSFSGTRFRGVMSGNDLSRSAFEELKRWNVNLLRYQMRPTGEEGRKINSPEKYMAWLDQAAEHLEKKILPLAREFGIQVVIDIHFRKRIYRGTDNRLPNATSLELLEAAWRKLAARFRGNPAIYGYDLLNEPTPEDATDNPWPEMAQKLVNLIREIDPETPIIIAWFEIKPFVVKGNNLIYSPHFYKPDDYTAQSVRQYRLNWRYPGFIQGIYWDKEQLRNAMREIIEFQKKHGVKIYVGEFSVVSWAPGGAQYLKDCMELFEEYGWDWSYHAFREWAGWSVEHAGSTRKTIRRIGDTDRKQVLLDFLKRNKETHR